MNVIGTVVKAIDWFVPARHREEEFSLARARIIVSFSFALAVWGPPFALAYYFTPGSSWGFLGSLVATILLSHVPFTLRYSRSLVLAGNCFILNVFLIVSYLSYIAGGHGAMPLAWDAALPMFAVAIVGHRSGLLWTTVALLTFAGFYCYDQLGFHMARQLSESQLKVLDFVVLCGLLLLILSMTFVYESNQDRSYRVLKASNEKLSETTAHLQAIVDNAADGIITVDPAGTIRSVNPAAERLFGYRGAEVLGQPIKMLMPIQACGGSASSFVKGLKADAKADKPAGVKFTGQRKNGQCFPLHVATGMARLNGKRLLVCILRDVTELVVAEEQEHQLQEMIGHSGDLIAMASLDYHLSYLNAAGRQVLGISRNTDVGDSSLSAYFTEHTWATIRDEAIPTVMNSGEWEGEGELQHFISGVPISAQLQLLLVRHADGPAALCIEAVMNTRWSAQSAALQETV